MSITSDIRAYADTALEQGKQVVGQAQAQLNDVTGQANELVGKLTGTAKSNVSSLTTKAADAVNDLRSQAEKAINLEAIKSAVEPYLAQAKQYRSSMTHRAEGILDGVRSDKRVAKVVHTAETLTEVVVDSFTERVVKPVTSLTGRGAKPATSRPSAKKVPVKRASSRPAATRPATRRAPAKKAPVKSVADVAPTDTTMPTV